MHKVTILSVGKLKEKYNIEVVKEYKKRLKPYLKLDFIELKNEPFNDSNKIKSKEIEGERIVNYLDKNNNSFVIALDEIGEELTSIEFSEFLRTIDKEIIFIIGGSLGLSDRVKDRANKIISLSRMTFLHEMVKVFLCEQLFRSVAILKGKKYHY